MPNAVIAGFARSPFTISFKGEFKGEAAQNLAIYKIDPNMKGKSKAERKEFWDANSITYTNPNTFKRPIPGIKSIDVQFKGGVRALRTANISWTCWSFEDLDRLMTHFLSHGKTVALEWGWVYNKKQFQNLPSLIEDEVFGSGAVITLPVKAPENAITRREESIDFLERVKYLYENWVLQGHKEGNNTHNVSATVSIQEKDWNEVREWLWDNQDSFNGLSFLPYDTGTYVQAPFEDIDETEYQKFSTYVKEINLENVLEMDDNTNLQGELACSGGACEIV